MTIELMLNTNDPDNGNWLGKLHGLAIGTQLSIDAIIIGAECRVTIEERHVRIGRCRVPFTSYCKWVGNWCWNSVVVSAADAAKVLNHVRSLTHRGEAKYSIESAETRLWKVWTSGQPFTARILTRGGKPK